MAAHLAYVGRVLSAAIFSLRVACSHVNYRTRSQGVETCVSPGVCWPVAEFKHPQHARATPPCGRTRRPHKAPVRVPFFEFQCDCRALYGALIFALAQALRGAFSIGGGVVLCAAIVLHAATLFFWSFFVCPCVSLNWGRAGMGHVFGG